MDLKTDLIRVFKTAKKADMYLYLPKHAKYEDLPEGLRAIFGSPIHALDILLTPKKTLARVDKEVLKKEIAEKGFYLQLPPPKEDYLLDLHKDTSYRYKDDV